MILRFRYFLSLGFFFHFLIFQSQNEASKWYFGNQAGIDFMTNPPTALTNGVMTNLEGSASIADASGNLLFYTNGLNVWNMSHTIMPNGTGLFGNSSSSQSAVIVKQPGTATLYYIFTAEQGCFTNGVRYSIVDMSLATGAGSVTSKNIPLHTPSSEKITAVKHCNGIDTWVITHDCGTDAFRCFLLTPSGLSTTTVVTNIGTSYSGTQYAGYMKTSPNGKKLAVNLHSSSFQLYDFDNSTGVVSNSLILANHGDPYGAEFSPDGTKLYGASWFIGGGFVYQWDLCAGSNTAIVASQYTVAGASAPKGGMQLASDGKIYVARYNTTWMAVINNPNNAGSACNYVDQGFSISPKTNSYGMVNFITSLIKPPPPPFTFSVSNSFGCQTASFTPPSVSQNFSITNCVAAGYSLTGMNWIFGDPSSGSANTSTLSSPLHAFTTLGTYTVSLVLYYTCGGGTDTIKQVVNVSQPCIAVNSTSITCANLGSATVSATGGTGPYSYTWMPTAQTTSVATNLSPGSYTITVFDFGNNFTYTATANFTSLIPLTGSVSVTPSVNCFGASNGTAVVNNLTGGSGQQSYSWFNGTTTYSTAFTNSLSAGIWSITVIDSLTGCIFKQSAYIGQPPAMVLQVSSSSPSACVGSSVVLTGTNSGGTPAYTYTWMNGPTNNTASVIESNGGTYVYTLTSRDASNCAVSNTISVDFINQPVLNVNTASVCPLAFATLTVSGANTFTWNNNTQGNNLTDNPAVNTTYTVTGSIQGCTSSATASISVLPLPSPTISSNSPVCQGQTLQLNASGGNTYIWTGTQNFSSSLQNPQINGVNINNSGVYSLTVTSVNGCTASTSATVSVSSTPTISAAGSTVCSNGTMNLTANSFPGASYSWAGPGGFVSGQQNPTLVNPGVNRTGNYTVTVSSTAGCLNSAVAHVSVTLLPTLTLNSDAPKCSGSTIFFGATGNGSFNWQGPNQFSSTQQNPVLNLASTAASGVYTVTITNGPCSAAATHTVIIYPLPAVTATTSGPACQTKSVQLIANTQNTVSYQWSGPNFFSSILSGPILAAVDPSVAGVYTIVVTDLNSCKASSQTTLVVLPNPLLSTTGATVCLGTQANLSVSGANTYSWSGPNFYQSFSSNASIQAVNLQNEGVYHVTGQALNSCTSVATATVLGLALPIAVINVLPSTKVCLNETLTLTGNGGTGYKWYGPNNFFNENKTVSFAAVNSIFAGTYTLVVKNSDGCESSTSTNILIDKLPAGTLSGKDQGCVPLCSDFKFTPDGSYKFGSSFNVLRQDFKSDKFSLCFYEAGTHTITASLVDSTTMCRNKLTFNVEVYQIPEADFNFSPVAPVEELDQVIFTNQSLGENQTKWNWYFKDQPGSNQSGEQSRFIFKEAGLYQVAMTVKNYWGCEDTIIKTVKVEADFHIYVPNIFTPNGDGENDVFIPVGRGVRLYHLRVFNRWGTKVFESRDLNQGWDGFYKGNLSKDDVYTWTIVASGFQGEQKILNGHITLLK